MSTQPRSICSLALTIAVHAAIAVGQQKPVSAPSRPTAALEFPVAMQQKIVAGTTPVGTKVDAKLIVATLVDGTVVPRNAVFSGEVTESVAKSATGPSRLAVRLDSARWKNGSLPVHVYLTAWFYPVRFDAGQELSYGPGQAAESWKTWNGAGAYPVADSPVVKPFPRGDGQSSPGMTQATTASTMSSRRALMKDIEPVRNSDGSITLACQRSNIKLDKLTTYIFAPGSPLPAQK